MGATWFSRSVFCLTVACFLGNRVAVAQSGPGINVPPGEFYKFCDEHALLEPLFELNTSSRFEPSYEMANSFISAQSSAYDNAARRQNREKLERNHMELIGRLTEIERNERDFMNSASSLSCSTGQPADLCVVASCEYLNGVNCTVVDLSGLAKEKAQVIDRLVKVLNKQVLLAATTQKRKKDAKWVLSALSGFKSNVEIRRLKVGIVYTCN